MGEAKRRQIINGGATGLGAADPEEVANCLEAVNVLLPQVEAVAASLGWSATLNALCTLMINLHIEQLGPGFTEQVLRQMARDTPRSAEIMRHLNADGTAIPPAGRA